MSKAVLTPWSRSFLAELAQDPENLMAVLGKHNIPFESYLEFKDTAAYRREYEEVKTTFKEEGITFKEKAKAVADLLLVDMVRLAKDPETPASVKAALFDKVTSLAGYQPKSNAQESTGSGFSVNIVLNGNTPVQLGGQTIEHRLQAEQDD